MSDEARERAWEAAAEKEWQQYSAVAELPWRRGPVSRIAFKDGYMMALEYPPDDSRQPEVDRWRELARELAEELVHKDFGESDYGCSQCAALAKARAMGVLEDAQTPPAVN